MEKIQGLSPIAKALLAGVAMFAISIGADYIRDVIVHHEAYNPGYIGAGILAVVMCVATYLNASKSRI